MKVKDLMEKLSYFDEEYELEFQIYCGWDMKSLPSLNDGDPDVYLDEEWWSWPRVIIDLWDDFNS